MKYFFAILICFFATSNYGQIIITAEEGRIKTEKLPYTFIKNKKADFPETGANVVWDYTYFKPCDNCESFVQFYENDDDNRSEAELKAVGTTSVLGFYLKVTEYLGTDETGDLYKMGKHLKSKTLPLRRITGHPLDRLKIEEYDFRTPILEYDFPFEYGKAWKTERIDTMRFLLNAASINLKGVKIEQISNQITEHEIVGYGKLKLPYFEGDSLKTRVYDALLLKWVAQKNIRFESNVGDERLKSILDLAGLKQRTEAGCIYFKFFVRELSPFIMTMSNCSGGNEIERVRLRTDLEKYPPKE